VLTVQIFYAGVIVHSVCSGNHFQWNQVCLFGCRLYIYSLTQQAELLAIAPLNLCRPSKKSTPYSITERRVPELIPVLGTQPAGDVSHKPGGRLPLLFARPAVTPATLNRTATNFAAW